jgi:hypothetical protein
MKSGCYKTQSLVRWLRFTSTIAILSAIFACTANATTGPRFAPPSLIPAKNHPLPLSALPAARVGPESGQSSKTWSYAYDKNNNMTSESFPRPAVALAGDYSNTMTYDALDRMTSRLVGKRSLVAAAEALFGSRTYTYSWDEGRNAVGKMTYARAYKPNALSTSPTAVMTYLHDGQGNRIITRHELTLDGMAPIIREFTQSFTPHYGPRMTYFNDAFTTTSPNTTWTQTVYDDRGMPSQLNLLRTGQPQQAIAGQTRNVAGLVTKRRTDQAVATGAMPFIERNWTYDKLGRC